jgi:hypothetical protein
MMIDSKETQRRMLVEQAIDLSRDKTKTWDQLLRRAVRVPTWAEILRRQNRQRSVGEALRPTG